MSKPQKEIKTSSFKISDFDYELLNKVLTEERSNYFYGKENYNFFRTYEKYLYRESFFREPEYEIQRLNKINLKDFEGEFDTNFYEKNFKYKFFQSMELKIQKLMGRKHLKSSLLYNNKLKTKDLIDKLISPIEDKIKYILNSNFIITKIEEIKTIKSAEDSAAYWHVDPVPMGYGKIFFYFSSSSDTDGKTEILNLRDSLEILKNGYNNIPIPKRKKEIKDLTKILPKKFGEKGKYMIFLSGLMLHKGSYPTYGVRKILSINFLRSPFYWRDKFDEIWSIDKLSGNWIPSAWPKHI